MNSSKYLWPTGALLILATGATAATVDNFQGGTSGTGFASGPGAASPGVTAGGPSGDYYRLLADGVASQNNRLVYGLTDAGAYGTINASFDYRMTAGTNKADGMGFFLLPTSVFGATGDGSTATAEEPNAARTLAFGFDIWQNVNDFSVHWDGRELANVVPNPVTQIDSNAGVFHRVNINTSPVGNSTHVQFTVTPDIFGTPGTPVTIFNEAILGLNPYENRIQFAGRTGGANIGADLDNLNVQYTTLSSLPVASAPGLFQDFDSTNTTNVAAIRQNLGPTAQPVAGGPNGAFVRLVNDGVNDQRNSIIFDRAADAGITNKQQTISFDLRMTNAAGAEAADGVGVFLLPTATNGFAGTTGAVNSLEPEQLGAAGALHVGFDLFPGGENNSVVVTANNVQIGRFAVAGVDLDSGQFNNARIQLTPTAGGTALSIILTPDSLGAPGAPVTVVNNVLIPGSTTYDYRVQFAGRTGGLNHSADIDNVQSTVTNLAATPTTAQDFTAGGFGGSGFKAYRMGQGLAPSFVDGGGGNTALRLIHDGQASQVNTVAFDQALDGIVTTQNAIQADFSFRANAAGSPADGFSLSLLPTSIYGTSGVGTNGSVPAEEPNIPNVFALGFDLYDEALGTDNVSLHFGSELVNITLGQGGSPNINLDDNVFHNVSLYIEEAGGDALVDLSIDGQAVLTDFLVAGYSVESFRAEFAGRTGGAFVSIDLDNIAISAIPEPGVFALLGAGGVLVLLRRRR